MVTTEHMATTEITDTETTVDTEITDMETTVDMEVSTHIKQHMLMFGMVFQYFDYLTMISCAFFSLFSTYY